MTEKKINGFEYYYVTTNGKVFSDFRGGKKEISGSISKKGYKRFTLGGRKNKKSIFCHRLVALTFIPNPNNYPDIDHINRDKLDNRVENLRWCNKLMNNENRVWSENPRRNNKLNEKYISKKSVKSVYKGKVTYYYYYQVIIPKLNVRKNFSNLTDAITFRNTFYTTSFN